MAMFGGIELVGVGVRWATVVAMGLGGRHVGKGARRGRCLVQDAQRGEDEMWGRRLDFRRQ